MCQIGKLEEKVEVLESEPILAVKWVDELLPDADGRSALQQRLEGYRPVDRYLSLFYPTKWRVGETGTVQCYYTRHTEGHNPATSCTCGIYADMGYRPENHRESVAFVVALWGRVLIYEHGYRAQYAMLLHKYGPETE